VRGDNVSHYTISDEVGFIITVQFRLATLHNTPPSANEKTETPASPTSRLLYILVQKSEDLPVPLHATEFIPSAMIALCRHRSYTPVAWLHDEVVLIGEDDESTWHIMSAGAAA
jgi:hypothetical protein